jgi:heme/copper-type cytochrome/quinol oxidase subunit 2
LVISIAIATAFFTYVVISTKSDHTAVAGFDKVKYQLHKYYAEGIGEYLSLLCWYIYISLVFRGCLPLHFSQALQHPESVHTIMVTAGQWLWVLEDGGYGQGPKVAGPEMHTIEQQTSNNSVVSGVVKIKAGETMKFVARSVDVNHGFSILSSSKSMDSPLMQMQVVPGYNNVFYYTFDKPGTYTIRC